MTQEYLYETKSLYFKHSVTSDPKSEQYRMHAHNMFELIFFVKGNATHIAEDKKYKLRPYDLILVRPLKHHFIMIDGDDDYERYDILFDEVTLGVEKGLVLPLGSDVINLEGNRIAKDIFQKMDYYKSRLSEEDFKSALSLLLKELFIDLGIEYQCDLAKYSKVSPLLSGALKYINDNFTRPINVKDVSQALFISESYLSRLFKTELKSSPKKYLNNKRLLYGRSLIKQGAKPTEIYTECGFTDYTVFYRSYQGLFKCTPSSDKNN